MFGEKKNKENIITKEKLQRKHIFMLKISDNTYLIESRRGLVASVSAY